MKRDINAISKAAMDLLNDLKTSANFDAFLNGSLSYSDWCFEHMQNVPDYIGISAGCTRLAFWDRDELDYVYKINIYTYEGEIDYTQQEAWLYERAVEERVEDCFAWVGKVIDDGMHSVYAMEFCNVDSYMLSSESWEYHAKLACEEEGYDWEHLTEEQRQEITDIVEESEYSHTEGMLDYAHEHMDDDLFYRFCAFINKYGINDLHAGNWGFYNNHLVVVDYAGYEVKLMKEVA